MIRSPGPGWWLSIRLSLWSVHQATNASYILFNDIIPNLPIDIYVSTCQYSHCNETRVLFTYFRSFVQRNWAAMGRAVLKFCLFIFASISASAFSLPFNPYPGKHLGWWSAASLSLRYWNDLWHRNVQVVKLSLSYLLVEGLVLSWIIVTIIMWYVSIIFISCCILYFVAIRPSRSEAEQYEYRLH